MIEQMREKYGDDAQMNVRIITKKEEEKSANPLNTIYIGTVLKSFYVRERKNKKKLRRWILFHRIRLI